MEAWQVVIGVVGIVFGPAGMVWAVLRGNTQRLVRIETKVDRINGCVGNLNVRVAVLEDRESR